MSAGTGTHDGSQHDSNGGAPPPKTPMPHVAFVLLAEFNIDTGSGVKHQYPTPTGTDEHMLADLMLPDGAHDRTEDWTVFFLNQTPSLTVHEPDSNVESESHTAPRLLYVMSLVRTKKDNTVRRGAICKAIAVCSPYPYIQIFKPILLLALEDYFSEPSIDCLSNLYNAINDIDVSGMPHLSIHERWVLRSSERTDMFEEKFFTTETYARSIAPTEGNSVEHSQGDIEYDSSMARNRSSYQSTDDMSDDSRDQPFIQESQTSQRFPLDAQGGLPPSKLPRKVKDTHFYDTRIEYGGKKIPVRVPLQTFEEEVGEYSLIKLIQIFSNPNALSPNGPLHPHLHTNGPFTHPIIVLFNALLTEKRIVFLGHGQPAGVVAELVLAACALGSGCGGILQGFTARAFPYSNLTIYEDFKAVPGYIAGVTNPIFEMHTDSWDVFCNIETGKITISKDIPVAAPASRSFSPPPLERSMTELTSGSGGVRPDVDPKTNTGPKPEAGRDSLDNVFMEEIIQAIQAHFGESVIRARFADYVQRFVRLASRYEESPHTPSTIGPINRSFDGRHLGSGVVFPDELTMQKEMSINGARIEGWQKTSSYKLYRRQFAQKLQTSLKFDISHQISRLRWNRKISEEEVCLLFQTLASEVHHDVEIVEVLMHLPTHLGGLVPLAFGLFHPSATVRGSALDLFLNLDKHPTGHRCVHSMNAFQKMALMRLFQERDVATTTSMQFP